MASDLPGRPVVTQIEDWGLRMVADLPCPRGGQWREVVWAECDYCGIKLLGGSPVVDGDALVCAVCGSLFSVSCDAETDARASEAWGMLTEDAHRRLIEEATDAP